MGILLQSNTPFRQSFEDSLGLIWEGLRKLRVVMASGRHLHHRWSENSGCNVDMPEMKWFLKLSMAFSAALTLFIQGGTRSNFILCSLAIIGH